jgi:predicted short-subunit dehydrogenase-like oxidoreductase (DUF2520 family)
MGKRVAIVGAGRVGRTLGRRLRALGWKIGAVVTRSVRTARAAVRAIGAGRPQARLDERVLDCDLLLIATPDRAIHAVADTLATVGGRRWRGKIVLHTSGARGRRPLEALARRGAATGSMHPMQTFSGRGETRLDGVVFAVEGDARARRLAARIARALGGVPVALEARRKPAYHAAGALAAGHLLAVVEAATRVLVDLGFPRRRAERALLLLARQTLDNFERLGPRAAWTGPLSRGDYPTVTRHAAALAARFPREYAQAYAALTWLGARLLSTRKAQATRRLKQIFAFLQTSPYRNPQRFIPQDERGGKNGKGRDVLLTTED